MKSYLIILAVLIALFASLIGYLFLNVDRFKPELIERLERLTGQPTEVGSIELAWDGALALVLKNVVVHDTKNDKSLLSIEAIRFRPRFSSLLKGRLGRMSVEIHKPIVKAVRDHDGSIKIKGLKRAPHVQNQAKSSPALGFLSAMDSIRIREGVLHLIDHTSERPALVIAPIQMQIKQNTLDSNINFEGETRIWSKGNNVRFEGEVNLKPQLELADLRVKTDMSAIDVSEFLVVFREMQRFGLQSVGGDLQVSTEKWVFNEANETGKVAIDWREGSLDFKTLKTPLKEIFARVEFSRDVFEVNAFEATWLDGKWNGSLVTQQNRETLESVLNLKAHEIPLESLVRWDAGAPYLKGDLYATLSGKSTHTSLYDIHARFVGSGFVQVQKPAVINMNVLDHILRNLARIPGIAEALQAGLPRRYREQLRLKDTALQPIRFQTQVRDGNLWLENVRVAAEGFEIYISGQVGPMHAFGKAALLLDVELSNVLLTGVPELQYLLDSYGRLIIPINISGTARKLRMQLDMDYILKQVLIGSGTRLLMQALQ